MKSHPFSGFFQNLKYDFPASIVVFLVALPLCLGIALASGAPLFSGIIAGIVGGIVVSLVSGSSIGVSGPAAGLAAIVLTAINDLGGKEHFDLFLVAVVIGGVLQIILGALRAGIIGYYFPSSVIKGMLSGIGIFIIIKQIPHAFGYDSDPEGDFAFFQVDGHTALSQLSYMFDFISPGALVISILSLAILFLYERPFMKKISFFKLVPGPLVVVILGILLGISFGDNETWGLNENQLVNIPVAGSFTGFLDLFTLPDFRQLANPQIYIVGFTIAIVASLETLLCVEATDKLDPNKRVTPTNRELIAQGIGNTISGLIGGLPITQVIVRSSANIQSGGRTKASAFIHGILLLVCAMSIPTLLNKIPLASLAAILFLVGYKLAKPALFKTMYRRGYAEFIPFIVTILGILFTDLLIGISLGLAVGIFQILWNNFKIPFHFSKDDYATDKPVRIELSEDVSFLNKAMILRNLNTLPDGIHVIIDGSKTKSIHPDVLEIIDDFVENAKTRDIQVELVELDTSDTVDSVKQFGKVILHHPIKKQ